MLLGTLAQACYFAELGGTQLALINDQRPLSRAVARERDPQRRALLEMVPALRSFARNVMQLPVGDSYGGYYETEQPGILFVLVGSERTRLQPYTWWFPIVGEVSYKSYVHEAEADGAAAELERGGYDAWVGPVTAYSSLGFFRDPVTTVMMRRGTVVFVEVLLHEMAHAKLYVPGQTDWNEQLASFVGRKGAEQYLRSRFGDDSALVAELQARERARVRSDALVRAALAELEALYTSGRPSRDILRARQPIFERLSAELRAQHPDADASDLVINNAHLVQYRRYLVGSEQLEAMWKQARGSWPQFWRLCRAYAAVLD